MPRENSTDFLQKLQVIKKQRSKILLAFVFHDKIETRTVYDVWRSRINFFEDADLVPWQRMITRVRANPVRWPVGFPLKSHLGVSSQFHPMTLLARGYGIFSGKTPASNGAAGKLISSGSEKDHCSDLKKIHQRLLSV
jgi:hypothetical protein